MSKLAGLVEAASFPKDDCSGSEANAGGGLRGSVPNETGWLPNKFFSIPVCKNQLKSPTIRDDRNSNAKIKFLNIPAHNPHSWKTK